MLRQPSRSTHSNARFAYTTRQRYHRDHSRLSRALKETTGAPIGGCTARARDDLGPRADAAFDRDYAPNRVLADGDRVEGAGWTLVAVATPGHTSNHLAFALPETGALFSGDTVMGWSTNVVCPPGRALASYIGSLRQPQTHPHRHYYSGH